MAHFSTKFEEAVKIIGEKGKNVKIHPIYEEQLKIIEKHIKLKNDFKGHKLYGICSYCPDSPEHLVAKYVDHYLYSFVMLIIQIISKELKVILWAHF